jgi:long-chain fatty acid transport protein
VRISLALTTLAGAATVASTAVADGGYYGGALGARAAGRSGAFVARADDPTAVAYNPAGLTTIGGTAIIVGNRFSYAHFAYTRAATVDWGQAPDEMTPGPLVSFAEVRNGKPWQALEPVIAASSNFGLRDWAFALGAFALPGTSVMDFPRDGGQRYMMRAREAIILDYAASAAWKFHDLFGVGVSLHWIAVPRLDYSLVIDGSPFAKTANPVSSPLDMVASTTGSDPFTFNATVGAWYRPRPFLQIGVAGQVIPTNIETKSTLTVTPINIPPEDIVITRNSLPANDVSVILPLPLMARAGVRYRGLAGAREMFDVELDVEYETWSRVNQFRVDTRGLEAEFRGGAPEPLGTIVVDKRWRDTVAVKLGGDVAVIPDRLALRAGAFYETAVAAPAYANVDFPGGPMLGGSLGSSVAFGRWEVAIAYQLRHMTSISVSEQNARVYQQVPLAACQPPYDDMTLCHLQFLGQPSPVVNAGRYNATTHYLSLALLYRYGS